MGFYSSIIMHPNLDEKLLRHESYHMLDSAWTKIKDQASQDEWNRLFEFTACYSRSSKSSLDPKTGAKALFSARKVVHEDGQ